MPPAPVFDPPIPATRPLVPTLEAFTRGLEPIWARRWLTNAGPAHQELEERVRERLGAPHLALFCNGTVALQATFAALDLPPGSEVVTTPFTFPATVDALHAAGLRAAFADVDPDGYGLSAAAVERAVTPRTRAILGLHVYGVPCDVEGLRSVAERHGLVVVYDAAAAFGVTYRGRSLASFGDAAMLSFHATKIFSTVEGGAVVSSDAAYDAKLRGVRSFGMGPDGIPRGPGLNGKLSEVHAAFGLQILDLVDGEIAARSRVFARYREQLDDLPLVWQVIPEGCTWNFAYVPVQVHPEAGGARDDVHAFLHAHGVHSRRYFWPLCSDIPPFSGDPSAAPENLPHAHRIARRILCLPQYGDLPLAVVDQICALVRQAHRGA